MPDTTYKEKIALELDASGVGGNSLRGLIAQLEEVETWIKRVNAAANSSKLGGGIARSAAELEKEIQKLQTKSGTSLKSGDLAKALKLDEEAFERFLANRKRQLAGYQSQLNQFRSAPRAAEAIARFEKESGAAQVKLGDLLKPAVSQVHGGGTMSVTGGKIALDIPAAQVQASVVGPITLSIPGSQITSGGRDPNTGQFVAGGGGGGGKKSGGKGPLGVSGQPNELQRVRVETEKYLRETITAVDEAGTIVSTVHDSVEGIIKTSRKTTTGATPLAQFREARRLAEENFRQLRAAINPNDPGYGLASLQKKQGEQLLALLKQPFMQQLGEVQQSQITRLIEGQALTLEAKGIQTFGTAQQSSRDLYYRGMFGRFTNEMMPGRGMSAESRRNYQAFLDATFGVAQGRVGYRAPIGPVLPSGYGAPIGPGMFPYQGPPPPRIPRPPVSPFARGLRSFTPTGFAANLLNVSGWAASVGVLYKSLELVNYSMSRFIDLGAQTAKLSVVFRGVGGSAKELTDDVLQLAAANGRDTDEAMASATEWSRLGLTRKEVGEAVRVSMEAANVAGMHTTETTKQLASLMHIYNLEVGDLCGVLGMLTTTSQRYNVTLEDLFQGLDRSAGSAKLAKMGLAELQGFIGTVVGKTGQSGTVVGNTIKSLLVNFANPDIQQYLRRFGVETLDKNLNQKSGSQILQELFVKWQTMDDRQKQNLTFRLVGRYSAARFVPMMDDYVQSQRMAIESQLNLNSAEEANVKILATMKAQLMGIRAEWDRLIFNKGGAPGIFFGGGSIADALTTSFGAVKNVMRLFNGDMPTGKNAAQAFTQTRFMQTLQKVGMGGSPFRSMIDLGLQAPFLPTEFFYNLFPENPRTKQEADFSAKMQQLTSRSGAMSMRARLLDTIAQVLPVAKGASLQSMTEVATSQLGSNAAAFQKALAGGDIAGAQAILRQASKGSQAESLQASGEAVRQKTQHLAELNLSLQNVNAEVEGLRAKGASQDALNKKLAEQKELQQTIRDLEADRSRAADDYAREAAEVADVVELKQQYLNLLREEETLLQGISELSEQQTLGTAGSRMDAQVSALTTSIELLKAQKETLDERGGSEDTQAAEEIRKQLADAEARKAALESPRVQAATRLFDARSIAAQRAREEAATYATGYTESEKLLNQQQRLRNTINGIESKPNQSDNDRVRIKELEISLWQNQEKIQARIVELAREERQIRIDSTREFQRSLLLAGPGEQLQRLYVAGLGSRRLGSGEFNALSPELKRMYYELRGGESGARVREERSLLTGQGMTVEQEQAAYERSRQRVARSGNILDRNLQNNLSHMPTMPLPVLDPVVTSAKAASEQLGLVATSASRASKSLDRLPLIIQRVEEMVGRGAASLNQPFMSPSPIRMDIQTGYALGAKPPAQDAPASPSFPGGRYSSLPAELRAGDSGQ